MSQGTGKAVKAKEIKIAERGKLIITKEVFDLIAMAHVAAITKEWSGILYYEIVEGDINDPSTLVCKTVDIAMMNIGSAGYTEFDYNLDDKYTMGYIDKMVDNPNLVIGNFHSHNSMACFFSGTDKDDLEENAKTNSGYLSLIGNYKHDIENSWCAKIGIFGTEVIEGVVTTRKKFKRNTKFNSWPSMVEDEIDNSEDKAVSHTIDILQVIDLDIVRDPDADWTQVDRAIHLQSQQGYTSNGVKGSVATTQYNANRQYLGTHYHQSNTQTSTTQKKKEEDEIGEESSKYITELYKKRDIKGGSLKESIILHLIFNIISKHSGINFTKTPSDIPSAEEITSALKYLRIMLAGEAMLLEDDLGKNFPSIVDKFYLDNYTLSGETAPDWRNPEYKLIAKLIIFTMLENDVKPDWKGFTAIKDGVYDYAEGNVLANEFIISHFTKFPKTKISRFNSFVPTYADVEDQEDNVRNLYGLQNIYD